LDYFYARIRGPRNAQLFSGDTIGEAGSEGGEHRLVNGTGAAAEGREGRRRFREESSTGRVGGGALLGYVKSI